MKAVKVAATLLVLYVGLVVVFESLLGVFQPEGGDTIVLTTIDEDGERHERVVSRLESGGQLYVAANHWPRAWYRRALRNPSVEVRTGGESRAYRAVPVSDAERERVDREHGRGLVFRFLTGFPPRELIRLEEP